MQENPDYTPKNEYLKIHKKISVCQLTRQNIPVLLQKGELLKNLWTTL